jgi:hypothetical protein
MGAEKLRSSLKAEAEDIIRRLSLIQLLSRYGDARVVGSVALDLIIRRDIDIHLLVEANDLFSIVDNIYRDLLTKEHVRDVRISDYRERSGILIAIDSYPGASGDWSIDIWITNRKERTGFTLVERLSQELHPEQREVIMKIKGIYHERGQLHDSMSNAIYEAVIDAGVRNLEGFQQFLAQPPARHGKNDYHNT